MNIHALTCLQHFISDICSVEAGVTEQQRIPVLNTDFPVSQKETTGGDLYILSPIPHTPFILNEEELSIVTLHYGDTFSNNQGTKGVNSLWSELHGQMGQASH